MQGKYPKYLVVILILYNRQPLPDDEPPQEEGQVQNQQEQQEDMPSENYCDFSIFISSTDGSGLVVEATTMDTEISLNNVMIAENIEA